MNKAYKIKLYPNNKQKELIDKTIGCSRFIYNKMLNEKIEIYGQFKELKISKELLTFIQIPFVLGTSNPSSKIHFLFCFML